MRCLFRAISIWGLLICFFHFTNAQQQSIDGSWGNPIPFDIVPVAVANLPDGSLITWSSQFPNTFVAEGDGMTYTELFDPFGNNGLGTALGSTVSDTDHDMFCPGINNLSDGRILSAGGTSSEKTSIYDWKTARWEVYSEMNIPRGYQGNVTLSDGSVFTLGGSWSGGSWGNRNAELWKENTGWSILTGIQASNLYSNTDLSKELGGLYRVDNHAWLWLAPDGSIFHAGPGADMHWFDVNENGSVQSAGKRASDTYSMKGTTVMFDVGKLLKVGGAESYDSGHLAKDASFVIDINGGLGAIPSVVPVTNNLSFPRTMHNSTVLPTGEVLVTGGLSESILFSDVGARLTAEIYNPTTNLWRTVAGMQVPRTYHSVAILMADARVFVGGGGLCDTTPGCENHFNAEIYSPPYLFDDNDNLAIRPSIQSPKTASFNTLISVSGTSNIQEFSLVRNSAATHSTNNEQRRIPLVFEEINGSYSLQIPNKNTVPPGYYMLFAIDVNGVPSVAEMLKIGKDELTNNPNLLVSLDFEELSGSVFNNSQGSDNFNVSQRDDQGNTVVANDFQMGVSGVFGSAVQFDGKFHTSNTILEADYSSDLSSIEDAVTVSAWVFRNETSIVEQTSKPANVAVFAHDYPAIFVGFHNSLLKWSFGTTDGFIDCYAGYAPLNQWTHIAVTYNGEIAKLYANGIEICSKPITGQIELRNDATPNSKFTISGFYEHRTELPVVPYGNSSGITDELDGKIDEFRIYNTALSNFQIKSIYEGGLVELPLEIPDCSQNLITAEYKIGRTGEWIEGSIITAPIDSEVFIRAKNYNQGYFITTPQIDGPTFNSLSDTDNFTFENGYQIDTFVSGLNNPDRNNGFIDISNTGKFTLTTALGCSTVVDLRILKNNDNCTGILVPEYRLNGIWYSDVNDVVVEEGDELVFSMLPNNIAVQLELPNGNIVGDNYTIGKISAVHAGTYTIFSSEGCVDYLNVGVNGTISNRAPEAVVSTEQAFGSVPLAVNFSGSDSVDDGEIVSYSWDFGDGSITSDVSNVTHTYVSVGIFTAVLTVADSEGLVDTASIQITVSEDTPCEGELIPEYRLDGVWSSGNNRLTVEEGTELLLSMLPNGIGLTIESPNGELLNDNHSLGLVDISDSGIYILRSAQGCESIIEIIVGDEEGTNTDSETDPDPDTNPATSCDGELIPEYRLDGVWLSGNSNLTIAEGTEVLLSMLPNGVGLTIESPTGQLLSDNHSLGLVDSLNNGIYMLRSAEGCVTTLEITVVEEEEMNSDSDSDTDTETETEPTTPCEGELITEYRLDGVWSSGNSILSLAEGTEVLLSMLPNGIGLTIESPNGAIYEDNFSLGLVDISDNGVYILRSSEGCISTIEIIVADDEDVSTDSDEEPEPDTDSDPNVNNPCVGELIPEYRLNGVWSAGDNIISVISGTEVLLSMLPNEIGLTIESPTGEFFNDNHSLGLVDVSDNGVYILRSDEGCINTIEIAVISLNLSSRISANLDIIEVVLEESEMILTPNPADNEVLIMFNSDFIPAQIEVHDASGRNLQLHKMTMGSKQAYYLNLIALPSGMYFVIATDVLGNRVQKKIIVNH